MYPYSFQLLVDLMLWSTLTVQAHSQGPIPINCFPSCFGGELKPIWLTKRPIGPISVLSKSLYCFYGALKWSLVSTVHMLTFNITCHENKFYFTIYCPENIDILSCFRTFYATHTIVLHNPFSNYHFILTKIQSLC